MKFNAFMKYAGSDGTIIEASNGDKWLYFNNTAMKIPEGKNVCGNIAKMPDFVDEMIYHEDYEYCELTNAYVPNATSKPSELMRTFSTVYAHEMESIDVPNKIYGFIEAKNETYISGYSDDDCDYTALLVTDDYGEDKEFKMIYVVKG